MKTQKTYLFRVNNSCSGDGPAICEFNRFKQTIKEATGKTPVMIKVKHFPLFGGVSGILYTFEQEVKDSLEKCDKSHFFPSKNVKG